MSALSAKRPHLAHVEQLLDEMRRNELELRRILLGSQHSVAETAAPANDPDLLTLKQAAFVFGKSEDTIRRWAVDEARGVQPGGRNTPWFVSRSEIIRSKRIMPG